MKKYIIFTDLDATLLDHDNYSYEAAQPALRRLQELEIPLVFNSSKTFSEMIDLKKEMANLDPFVAENGSVIGWPKEGGYLVETPGLKYSVILDILKPLKSKYKFKGFSDYTTQELSAEINMSEFKTASAQDRLGSEPIKWLDDEDLLQEFIEELKGEGLQLIKGGRFQHVMGRVDKSTAMKNIVEYYNLQDDEVIFTIALGDSPNDKLMLEASDFAVIIPNPHGRELKVNNHQCVRAEVPGALGWNNEILKFLKKEGM